VKPAIVLSILSILTITLPTSAQTKILVRDITPTAQLELEAEARDITTIVGGGEFFYDENKQDSTHKHLSKLYVTIKRNGNSYSYFSQEEGDVAGKWIKRRPNRLANGKLTKSGGKHFYKWTKGGNVYQVTWQPADPYFARIQVFNPSGKEVFNRLLYAMQGGD
jgi:hypothetical protein